MKQMDPYRDFISRMKLLTSKNPNLIATTLSNIFSMRSIGNKTHGDLAEVAIKEFINQYMYDFHCNHVGKDLYRAKSREEDIKVINEITEDTFPISLKAYGDGPLQLSTDKSFKMFPRLEQEGEDITEKITIEKIFADPAFVSFQSINVLSLVYDESSMRCNILVFDYDLAMSETTRIVKEGRGGGRIHPVFKFYDGNDSYICEVRYGGASANALQRGLWTNTKRAVQFFDSITSGWIDYFESTTLVDLFSKALVSSRTGHSNALEIIQEDIMQLRQGLPASSNQ